MSEENYMKLYYFTQDNAFPFFIQYGSHEDELFIHGHEDFVELVIVLDGSAVHIVNNERFMINKGDVFVMNEGVFHGYEKAENFKICNIMFRTDTFISENYDIRLLPGFHALFLLEPKYNNENGFKSRLKLSPVAFSELKYLLKHCSQEYYSDVPGRKTMVYSYFLQIIVFLSRLYETAVHHKEIEGISKAAAFMETHFMDDIGTSDLLKVSHYSQRHFIRLFSSTYSTTPQQYLLGIRIRNACNMLKNKSLSITEIATQCGFNDSNYFCRIFKKNIGMTPSMYRKTTII